uniref:Bm1629, isoform a n=1 Tax=Brugia malayi TaxID=6279 RepID=A0A1I9G606_BRUMA|nr:Bm1629, isoform a [Brugia malayi]
MMDVTCFNSSRRVSFDEQRLKTFVYDKDTIDGSSEILHIKSPFTEILMLVSTSKTKHAMLELLMTNKATF